MHNNGYTIVFDLDGTLVDSVPDIRSVVNGALKSFINEPFTLDEIKSMVGHGLRALLKTAFSCLNITVSDIVFEQTYDTMISLYDRQPCSLTVMYPGTLETLQTLSQQGYALAVCTNKQQSIARQILQDLNIASYFSSIVGGLAGQPLKPDPLPLLKAINDSGGQTESSIMIGDSIVDIQTAIAGNVPSIAVSYGYSKIAAEELGADLLADEMSNIPQLITQLVIANT